jgi:hypothetical protein
MIITNTTIANKTSLLYFITNSAKIDDNNGSSTWLTIRITEKEYAVLYQMQTECQG